MFPIWLRLTKVGNTINGFQSTDGSNFEEILGEHNYEVQRSTLDPDTVLDRILEQMGRLLSIQMYAVIALDEENGTFRIRASPICRSFCGSIL